MERFDEFIASVVEKFGKFAERPDQLFVVGGAVRDAVMGNKISDVDLAFVGTEDDLRRVFGKRAGGRIHRHAPVFNVLIGEEIHEVALARTEIGNGNSESAEFELVGTIDEDMWRRDFTVNAIAVDVFDGTVVDEHGGIDHAVAGILHPVGEKFVESPERIGRAAMMIARFGMEPSQRTLDMCVDMMDDFAQIPPEQMWNQFWAKALTKGVHFQKMFEFMDEVGMFFDVFPIFARMMFTQQDPEWHPEGNVLVHTAQVMEAAVREDAGILVMLAALCHDMGKPKTTAMNEDGRIVSPGHADEQEAMNEFMRRIHVPHKLRNKVRALVRTHMQSQFPTRKAKARFIRKLDEFEVSVDDWAKLVIADASGRGSGHVVPSHVSEIVEFDAEFAPEQVSSHARPLVNGFDLMGIGLRGRQVGDALDRIHEMWMIGEIGSKDEALEWAKSAQI